MPRLARIDIYPIKSLDPLSLDEVEVLDGGALAHDRRFALRDAQGNILNAKRTAAAHRLRTQYDPQQQRITLRIEGTHDVRAFDVQTQRRELASWLSEFFAMPLEVVENAATGFPDDTDSPGPTVISTATLERVASWYPGMRVEEVRARFRANLEIDGVEPFWEDRLVADRGIAVRFRIGDLEWLGTNACQRCPVPTRHPQTGEVWREFAKTFARRREAELPAWAPAAQFDHFYRLSVNTRPGFHHGGALRVGDPVSVVGQP